MVLLMLLVRDNGIKDMTLAMEEKDWRFSGRAHKRSK